MRAVFLALAFAASLAPAQHEGGSPGNPTAAFTVEEREARFEALKERLRREPRDLVFRDLEAFYRSLEHPDRDPLAARVLVSLYGAADSLLRPPETLVRLAREAEAAIVHDPDPARRATLLAILADRLRVADGESRSAPLLAEAERLAAASRDPKAEAAVLLTKATAAYREGNEVVVTLAEQALRRAEATGNASFLASTRLGVAGLLLFADKIEDAATLFTAVRDRAQEEGALAEVAAATVGLGRADLERGDLGRGLLRLDEGLALWTRLHVPSAAIDVAADYAHGLARSGRWADAVAVLERAEPPSDTVSRFDRSVQRNRQVRARYLGATGRHAEALALGSAALVDAEASGDAFLADQARLDLANLHLAVGRFDDASALAEAALRGFAKTGVSANAGMARFLLMAIEEARSHDPGEAEQAIERFLATEGPALPPELRTALDLHVGELAADAGDLERASTRGAAVLATAKSLGARQLVAGAELLLARCDADSGRYEAALARAGRVSGTLARLGDRQGHVRALELQGLAQARLGRIPEAEATLLAAHDDAALAVNGLLDEEQSHVERRSRGVESTAIAMHWRAAGSDAHAIDRGFAWSERRRGRALLAAFRSRASLVARRLPLARSTALASMRERLRAADAALDRALRSRDEDDIEATTTDRDATARDLDSELRGALADAGEFADFVRVAPVPLVELRRTLAPDQALLAYEVAEGRVFGLAVAPNGVLLRDLGDADALTTKAEGFRRLVAVPASSEAGPAAELFDLLVRPLLPRLDGATRLLLATSGTAIAELPFEALLDASASPPTRLTERYRTAYVVSATRWFEAARRSPASLGTRIVALGDPRYPGEDDEELASRTGLARLKESGDEARSLHALVPEEARGALLLREQATREQLVRALSDAAPCRWLHLACHGIVDRERPRRSALVLANGEFLFATDLATLDLRADLVVLSACSSGSGGTFGDGIAGIARGFLAAGCPRLVAATGRVEDARTRAFMLEFARRVLIEGMPPAEALRTTRIAALRRGGAEGHPSAWCRFVLWGLDS